MHGDDGKFPDVETVVRGLIVPVDIVLASTLLIRRRHIELPIAEPPRPVDLVRDG
jgi:hypothetical protein